MPDILTTAPQDDTVAKQIRDLLKVGVKDGAAQRADMRALIANTQPLLERKIAITSTPFPPNPARDFQFEVRRDNVENLIAANVQGHADGMGTSFQGMWGDTADISPGIIALYDTPSTVKVASTDANDTSGGTGAGGILLVGHASNGEDQNEVIVMNGQTEVTSTLVYKAVEGLTTLGAGFVGSGQKNAGNIWCGNGSFTSGVPATKYLFSEAADTIARSSVSFVPAEHVQWIIQLNFTIADTGKALDLHINSYDGSIHRIVANFEVGAGFFNTEAPAIPAFPPGTLWWLTGKVSASTADVTTIIAFNEEHLEAFT